MDENGRLFQDGDMVAVMTTPYAAPEVITCYVARDGSSYDHRADYWSLAVVAVALLFGEVRSHGSLDTI